MPSFYRLIRPILFLMDAESVHSLVMKLARFIFRLPLGRKAARVIYAHGVRPLPVTLAGLEFQNPIGLAAGFDKNAVLIPGLESLGFGFIEIGTVTPRPQSGNPRPRLSRVPEKRAIVNRMGFNNDGAEIIARRLKDAREALKIPIGVNIGKNRDTPNSEAVRDYDALLNIFNLTASYFTVNVSSPNTPGLRDLQSAEFIKLVGARVLQRKLSQPVFVKLAPDIGGDELRAIGELCGDGKPFAGLILTNTIPTDLGGLSGLPLKGPSTSILKLARSLLPASIPVISVGGIESVEDVLERFTLGANAVQLYSSLIYNGPGLPGRLLRELQAVMKRKGIRSLSDLRQR